MGKINKDIIEQVRKKHRKVPEVVPTKEDRITKLISDGKRLIEELKRNIN